jgi:hypothetical protein
MTGQRRQDDRAPGPLVSGDARIYKWLGGKRRGGDAVSRNMPLVMPRFLSLCGPRSVSKSCFLYSLVVIIGNLNLHSASAKYW